MYPLTRRGLLAALGVTGLAGCLPTLPDPGGGTSPPSTTDPPIPPVPSTVDHEVGEVLATWTQSSGTAPVLETENLVITTATEYEEWLGSLPDDDGLPEAMDVDDPLGDGDDAVLVPVSFGDCAAEAKLIGDGDGTVRAEVERDENVDCEWTPVTMVLFRVDAAELGVDSPSQVTRTD